MTGTRSLPFGKFRFVGRSFGLHQNGGLLGLTNGVSSLRQRYTLFFTMLTATGSLRIFTGFPFPTG